MSQAVLGRYPTTPLSFTRITVRSRRTSLMDPLIGEVIRVSYLRLIKEGGGGGLGLGGRRVGTGGEG